ncbi:hypothetical protein [Pontibacter chitinilyticus]|uniref:hypothetical protein n=1 Tax=Pontibacter chitinilyticus TaxID=2674989 RepID=UPI00321A3035
MTAPINFSPPYISINFRKDLDVLISRWAETVNLPEFRTGYTQLLQVAKTNQAYFWLADLRLRNLPDEDSCEWYLNDFVPMAMATLTRPAYLAYLFSPTQFAKLPQASTVAAAISKVSVLHTRCFTIEHDALEWLNSCRRLALA